MAARFNSLIPLKQMFSRSGVAAKPALPGGAKAFPKGFIAVYVGESSQEKKRYLIPVSYVNKPQFQQLLNQAESEYGFHHPTGGLTIPCTEEVFLHVTSCLIRC